MKEVFSVVPLMPVAVTNAHSLYRSEDLAIEGLSSNNDVSLNFTPGSISFTKP